MKKVLIIDDDRTSREIVKRAVESRNYIAIQSGNGRHGWETLWENDDIEFIITDMAMPDMDGRELMHLIRSEETLKELPVIIISGCVSGDEIGPILKISPSKTLFMPKPLDTKLLQKYIDTLLANQHSSGETEIVTN